MKLMQKKYREAMEAQGLTRQRLEDITGLLPRAISWIFHTDTTGRENGKIAFEMG